jgi:tetratricopeptide (TPR) repeat protein
MLKSLGEQVRQSALAFAEQFGRSLVVHEAEQLIDSLFGRPLSREDVVAYLRTRSTIKEAVRRQALALVESVPEDATTLNWHSWVALLQRGADEAACRLALRRAETACRLIPNHGGFLNTLGVAQYRLGMFEEATKSLTQADQVNRASLPGSNPADLAFLSLAENRLVRRDRARAALSRLRETMKEPKWDHANRFHVPLADMVYRGTVKKLPWSENPESQAFQREAEELEMDLSFPANPMEP